MIPFSIIRPLTVYEVEQPCTICGTWTEATPDVPYLPNGDPGYPGDPGEIEVNEVRDANGRLVPDAVWDGLIDLDDLYEAVVKDAEEADESAAHDAGDAKRERDWEREIGWD